MPKKTIDEFKEIFAPIKKKPSRPTNISAKDKDLIESDIDEKDMGELRKHIQNIKDKDPAYAADLVAYKIGKHLDDPKVQIWLRDVDPDLVQKAVMKIIPRDLTDPATVQQYRKAQKAGNAVLLQIFDKRDDKGVSRLLDQDAAEENTRKIKEAYEKNNRPELEQMGASFKTVVKAGDPVALAKANPKLFFESVMKGFKEDVAGFVETFGDKKLRDDLKQACPKEWKTFAAATPMLATLDKVDEAIGKKKDATDTDQLDTLFDAILDPKVLPLTYVATLGGYRNIDIMAGETDSNAKALKKLKETTGAPGPATDCHNLQNLTLRLIEASFGKKIPRAVEDEKGEDGYPIPKGKAKGMVLTRPLSAIEKDAGQKGLIGSFQGNVFDESDKPTGKVFFTGDDAGEDSHSWLVVTVDTKDGKKQEIEFDPVLGTKGEQVVKAIDEQSIKWADQKRKIALTPKGWYLVFRPDKTPGANQIGVSSYYTITKTAPEGLAK